MAEAEQGQTQVERSIDGSLHKLPTSLVCLAHSTQQKLAHCFYAHRRLAASYLHEPSHALLILLLTGKLFDTLSKYVVCR